jgi:antitoxin (DNA-binding transcriptional repressor) of toxin-antitoxin stability system
MKSIAVGEFKAQFSSIIKELQAGHSIAITYGKKRTKLAVLVPYDQYVKSAKRQIGVLQGKASYNMHDDFKLTDEAFLRS